jgi:glycosyltransferase involved in cell wall biosynthesis
MVLMACRLLWTKGVGEFVTAAEALRAGGISARFVLAGEPDPSHPSSIPLRMIEQWHQAGHLEWVGCRHDMPALISQSHIVCLPSSYGEGVPRILIEAAACGRPIVASNSPGCREVVRHGENGLLIPTGDVAALVAAITRLLHDAQLRSAMGKRGREIAIAEFSMEQTREANLAVYRALLTRLSRMSDVASVASVK